MPTTEVRNQTQAAKISLRVLGAICDSLLVSLAWYYIIELWGHEGSTGAITRATAGGKVLSGGPAILLMLGTAAYWIVMEWQIGATVGKLILGLRVKSLDGTPISLMQSMKRNILRLADFFPFYLPGFLTACLTPNRQRLGDLWAKTIVVRERQQKA
jgi:uncharacterized RDD family membrane protein YckC